MLKATYNLTKDSTDAEAKQIGLDFLNDAMFANPAYAVAQRYKAASIPVYEYIFDQVNPFDPSAKAHHSVELMFIFKGYDISKAAGVTAKNFSKSVQEKWVTYGVGGSPWAKGTCYAFGPNGQMGPITSEELETRRRLTAYEVLSQIPLYELCDVVEHFMRFIASAI